MDSMTVHILVTVAAIAAYAIGLAGIVVPIIPGTITIMVATLVWAIILGSTPAWVAFALVALFGIGGMLANYFITGRSLRRHDVPMWPIVVGLISGIVGIFVIPFVGLIIGFLLGLYVVEAIRLSSFNKALSSSWVAIKALGIGFGIELLLALLSTLVFAIAATVHFVNYAG